MKLVKLGKRVLALFLIVLVVGSNVMMTNATESSDAGVSQMQDAGASQIQDAGASQMQDAGAITEEMALETTTADKMIPTKEKLTQTNGEMISTENYNTAVLSQSEQAGSGVIANETAALSSDTGAEIPGNEEIGKAYGTGIAAEEIAPANTAQGAISTEEFGDSEQSVISTEIFGDSEAETATELPESESSSQEELETESSSQEESGSETSSQEEVESETSSQEESELETATEEEESVEETSLFLLETIEPRTLVNTGTDDVTVTIAHYNNANNQELYRADYVTLKPGETASQLEKATNWTLVRMVWVSADETHTSLDLSQAVAASESGTLQLFYTPQITSVQGDTTFYDYLVKPYGGRHNRDQPTSSINTAANYPRSTGGSVNRLTVGTMSQNFDANKYNAFLDNIQNNQHNANVYISGLGGLHTGIVTGLSSDYQNVIFNASLQEPGLFSSAPKAGKTILTDYQLQFTQTGDTYVLSQVNKPNGSRAAYAGDNFFPLDDASSNLPDKGYDSKHNYFFGMRYDISFRLGDYVGPLNYSFSGDDDLWVILDGTKVVIDLGGIHDALGSSVNLWNYLDASDKTTEHRLTVLYMERGGNLSNCNMNFTLPEAQIVQCNPAPKATLAFLKTSQTRAALPGAEFTLYKENTCVTPIGSACSNEEGVVEISNLNIGTYYMKETGVPEGYQDTGEVFRVEVSLNDDMLTATAKLYRELETGAVQIAEVVNVETLGNLTITKTIDEKKSLLGDPIFSFCIQHLDEAGNITETRYEAIRFLEVDGLVKSVTIENLPAGMYRITELATQRYQLSAGSSQIVTSQVRAGETAQASYSNELIKEDYFSDTDVVKNSFTVDENGQMQIHASSLGGTSAFNGGKKG